MQTTPGTSLTDDTAIEPPISARPEIRLWLVVVVLVYALDQASKWWAESALDDGRPRELIDGVLQLHLAHNPGAAFSTGTSYTFVLTLIALVVIGVCIRMAGRMRSRAWALALGLILGGALGNVTDRIFRDPSPLRGHVVDFIEFPHWPIFNVADSAITVAAALFIYLSFRGVRLDGTLVAHDADDETSA